MEEKIRYEHIRNDTIGFEMDYDYERFERRSEPGRECFVLRYDNPEDPMNYLEVTYNTEDADAVSASVSEVLSNDYDIIKESFTLDRTGSSLEEFAEGRFRIHAETSDGNQYTYQTSESENNILEYYGTWQEDEFSEKYSGGSSLSRID